MANEANVAPSKLKPHCCFVGCQERAEWQLWDGPGLEDYTESCTSHVGAMLTDAEVTRVCPIATKRRIGMYDETPKIRIGRFTICEATIPVGNQIWIEESGEDGGAFDKGLLEPSLKGFFDKHL